MSTPKKSTATYLMELLGKREELLEKYRELVEANFKVLEQARKVIEGYERVLKLNQEITEKFIEACEALTGKSVRQPISEERPSYVG